MELTEELKQLLYAQGADLVGIGDMRGIPNCTYRTGISVAVRIPRHIVTDLLEAPTKEYYDWYHILNKRLNEIIIAGEEFLKNKGYDAYAQTTDRVAIDKNNISKLPHKTVATRSGLGWIGKNCLLVTPQYGSAIRISSLLTDAPCLYDERISRSLCGSCTLCVDHCPAGALAGTLWEAGIPRDQILDADGCYRKQLEIMTKNTGIQADLCGKCFAVCAYTQRYLKK